MGWLVKRWAHYTAFNPGHGSPGFKGTTSSKWYWILYLLVWNGFFVFDYLMYLASGLACGWLRSKGTQHGHTIGQPHWSLWPHKYHCLFMLPFLSLGITTISQSCWCYWCVWLVCTYFIFMLLGEGWCPTMPYYMLCSMEGLWACSCSGSCSCLDQVANWHIGYHEEWRNEWRNDSYSINHTTHIARYSSIETDYNNYHKSLCIIVPWISVVISYIIFTLQVVCVCM